MALRPESIQAYSRRVFRWAAVAALGASVALIAALVGRANHFALVIYSLGAIVAIGNALVRYGAVRRASRVLKSERS